MRDRAIWTRRGLLAGAVAMAGLGALAALLTWVLVSRLDGWSSADVAAAVALAATLGGGFGAVFGQPLFATWLEERRTRGARPAVPAPEHLAQWCEAMRVAVLERRVRGPRSQREQMLRDGMLVDQLAAPEVAFRIVEASRPRLRVRGRTVPWSNLAAEWTASPGRLVVLGDPGYGKTVAALTLVGHINATDPDRVAELFPLAEWPAWAAAHGGPELDGTDLGEWLAHQLTITYPEISRGVAHGLVARGHVIPVLDGLDEVPPRARPACKRAIDAYAGRAAPFRPMVVTCRRAEYAELAPSWVSADRHVALVGLATGQIVDVIEAHAQGRPDWEEIRTAVSAGDVALRRLLGSPLRLAAALHAYRGRDARELSALASTSAAEARIWDLLMTASPRRFGRSSSEEVRTWLSFLASGMRAHARQRFWLHELYLYGPPGERRRFTVTSMVMLLAVTSIVLLLQAGAVTLLTTLVVWTLGFLTLAMLSRSGRLNDTAPEPILQWTRTPVPWSSYLGAAIRGFLIGLVLCAGIAVLMAPALLVAAAVGDLVRGDATSIAGLSDGFARAMAIGMIPALVLAVVDSVGETDGQPITEEPPDRLTGAGPSAVLRATGRRGVTIAISGAVLTVLAVAALQALVPAPWQTTLPLAATLGLIAGAMTGHHHGLSSWLFHYWLRVRLWRRGELPLRLRAFLDWAAEPGQAWLRAADAFEFRHRELLDHLSAQRPPVGVGNLSAAEALASRSWGPTARSVDRANRVGVRWLNAGRHEEALAQFSEAAEKAPGNLMVQRNRVVALVRLGRCDDALALLDALLATAPNAAALHLSRAWVLSDMGRALAALAAANEAVRRAPQAPTHHQALSVALYQLNRSEEQLRALDRAIELDPQDDWSHGMRSVALARLGRIDEARGAVELATRLAPDSIPHLVQLGQLSRTGDGSRARATFERALERRPTSAHDHMWTAIALLELGRPHEAETAIATAVALDERNLGIRFAAIEVAIAIGRPELVAARLREAFERWDPAREDTPGDPPDLFRHLVVHQPGPLRARMLRSIVAEYARNGALDALEHVSIDEVRRLQPQTTREALDAMDAEWRAEIAGAASPASS